MIKHSNLRQTLGITQEEAAILLKTTKSQIAMFELGLRELPTSKMLKFVTLYNHVKNKQQDKSNASDLKAETAKSIAVVEQELKDNELKLLLLNKELEGYKAKYQKYSSIVELVAYLETELSEKEQPSPEFMAILRRKAIKGMEKNGVHVQLKCELALKAAQLYNKELKKELERCKSN